jgi:hypothetical protein
LAAFIQQIQKKNQNGARGVLARQVAAAEAFAAKQTSDVSVLERSLATYGADVSLIHSPVEALKEHKQFPFSKDLAHTAPDEEVIAKAGEWMFPECSLNVP